MRDRPMMNSQALAAAALMLALTGCNRNTAPGNDREAAVDAPPTPAPVMGAETALANVAPEIIKPETMSNADIQALGGREGRCAVKLTEVAFPSFLYQSGGSGAIKLNGKLIVLPAAGEGRFTDGDLSVTLRLLDDEGNAGLRAMQMIVVPPGAADELGYSGYVECYRGGKA